MYPVNKTVRKHWAYGLPLPLIILILNVAIAAKLFVLEYSANLASNEGSFIALARRIASEPSHRLWWPLWDCGIPFQNTYLPLLPLTAGWFSRITGHSPALSFHQVGAAAFCLGPVFLYYLALAMSRMRMASFLAAFAYSVVSPCAAIPSVRADLGSLRHLRRLQILSFYGEAPHTMALMYLALAILFVFLTLVRGRFWHYLLAGMFAGLAVLSNAFAAVILAMAVAALAAVYGKPVRLVPIVLLSYLWICPLLPPSVVHAIRTNSPLVEGDYRFTMRSLAGVAILAAGFALAYGAMRRTRWSQHLRFWILFAWLTSGVLALGVLARIYVVPQPHRYQIAADLSLCTAGVFLVVEATRRFPRRTKTAFLVLVILLLAVQARHAVRYARAMTRSSDIAASDAYRIARWLDTNLHGQRVMVSGSYSFYADDFADIPQLHGGHDPMQLNPVIGIAVFTIYSGMNTGAHDGEVSALWLTALGAHAVVVPGPGSSEYYKPFVNPRKFEGLLPVLWRDGANTIYAVPARDASLAHVMDAGALVQQRPENGLDTAQLARYVEALKAPYPPATWKWDNDDRATIQAVVMPRQVVATQVTYDPGWHAAVGGLPQPAFSDGLGFLVVKPDCHGFCTLSLWYDGGAEWRIAKLASCCAMLAVFFTGIVVLLRTQVHREHKATPAKTGGPHRG